MLLFSLDLSSDSPPIIEFHVILFYISEKLLRFGKKYIIDNIYQTFVKIFIDDVELYCIHMSHSCKHDCWINKRNLV